MSKVKQWVIYFDASALVKRYSEETGSSTVDEVFRYLPLSQITCSGLSVLEIASVLVRKRNDGRLSQKSFQQTMIEFKAELIAHAEFSTSPVDDMLLLSALDLIAKHNINATDAVILRSALNLQQILQRTEDRLMLWTADKRLARAAQSEGLTVFDPEVETISHLHQLLGISEEPS
jgi:predicted nucleic acid-binding protein